MSRTFLLGVAITASLAAAAAGLHFVSRIHAAKDPEELAIEKMKAVSDRHYRDALYDLRRGYGAAVAYQSLEQGQNECQVLLKQFKNTY